MWNCDVVHGEEVVHQNHKKCSERGGSTWWGSLALLLAGGVLASATGCGGGGGVSAADVPRLCEDVCSKVEATGCTRTDNCVSKCRDALPDDSDTCQAAYAEALNCTVSDTVSCASEPDNLTSPGCLDAGQMVTQKCDLNTDASDDEAGTGGSTSTSGDDSCVYANDGFCDEPNDCDPGTDSSDCSQ